MTSSTYPSSSLTSYPTTVLDPLLQASSLASAASVQTTSGEAVSLDGQNRTEKFATLSSNSSIITACFWKEMGESRVES